MKRIMGSFLNLLCDMCGAERARLRVTLTEDDRTILVCEESALAPIERPLPAAAGGIQLPLLSMDSGLGGSFVPPRPPSHFECGAIPTRCGEPFEGDGPGQWRLARTVDGLRLELTLVLRERSPGFVNERLWNAAAILDLFEAMLDGRCDAPRRFRDETAGIVFDPPLLGDSPAMIDLKRKIAAVSLADISLLVEGESGTGKEVIARNVHRLSRRRAKPFVVTSSMEMPHSLLQSELFGHAEGAFTGASRDRTGLIENAGGGTFFLDEIGEMPLSLQAALLRVLQEKEVRRLGESRRRPVDVRFVFATNRDLGDLVRKGRFRKDLYFRIAGVRLQIPPLRMRREDVAPLARFFLDACAEPAKRRPAALSPGVIKRLVKHRWPGNVRELKNEMERVVALYSEAAIITSDMLSPQIGEPVEGSGAADARDGGTIPGAVQRLERAMIREALARFAGNRTRAAEALGITRQGLLKKLKRYGEPV